MLKFHTARTLTAAIMALALTMSFVHIAHLFGLMGAGWEQWTAPILIDTVAIIGKIASGPEFTAATRRAGRRALYVAGSVSLVANVTVGYVEQKYGSAVIGAIVVTVALWGEGMIAKLRPTAATRRTRKPSAAPAPAPAKPAAPRKPRTRKAPAPALTHPAAEDFRNAAAYI